jgi:hypothetical protein
MGGSLMVFEFNWRGRTIPRKGRITKINPDKQRIKIKSNSSGGYGCLDEEEPGVPSRMYRSDYWREFWIDMEACPIIIGDMKDRIQDL